jgi:hypothetical protein
MIARLRRTREPRRIVGGTRRPRRSGSSLPTARCLLNHCGRRTSACPADVAHQLPARAGSEAARREAGMADRRGRPGGPPLKTYGKFSPQIWLSGVCPDLAVAAA